MALNVIQTTQINQKPFTITHPKEVNYPVAPLVSAKLFTPSSGVETLKIRVTLYIDAADTQTPRVEPNPATINNSLQLYFDYNYSEETPINLNVWYIELDFISPTVGEITSITSFLKDIDPETSRGTVTVITP